MFAQSAKAYLAKLKGTMSNCNSLILALCGLALAVSPLQAQDAKAKKLEVRLSDVELRERLSPRSLSSWERTPANCFSFFKSRVYPSTELGESPFSIFR